jgi:hypothetical protein
MEMMAIRLALARDKQALDRIAEWVDNPVESLGYRERIARVVELIDLFAPGTVVTVRT